MSGRVRYNQRLLDPLLVVYPQDTKKSQKILLPDWQKSLRGEIIGMSDSVAKELNLGDVIVFGAAKGMESVFNGVAVRILKLDDVDGVMEDDDEAA